MAASPKEMRWGKAGLDPVTLGTRVALRGTAMAIGFDRQKGPGGRGGSPCKVTDSKHLGAGSVASRGRSLLLCSSQSQRNHTVSSSGRRRGLQRAPSSPRCWGPGGMGRAGVSWWRQPLMLPASSEVAEPRGWVLDGDFPWFLSFAAGLRGCQCPATAKVPAPHTGALLPQSPLPCCVVLFQPSFPGSSTAPKGGMGHVSPHPPSTTALHSQHLREGRGQGWASAGR